ncbi:MAG: hypothetical protein QXR57_05755 [Metallosphaera sp.]|uniref:hypothetical protein n=1 Tax=Metallosphaera sp. TaxID=2020860 RepID=UPI000B0C7AEF
MRTQDEENALLKSDNFCVEGLRSRRSSFGHGSSSLDQEAELSIEGLIPHRLSERLESLKRPKIIEGVG